MKDMYTFLFVYGELKQGGKYHQKYLKNAIYLGKGLIHNLKLKDLGDCPAAIPSSIIDSIIGEIYLIPYETLDKLDLLEEINILYRRERFTLQPDDMDCKLTVWVYTYIEHHSADIIAGGDWTTSGTEYNTNER